MRKVSKAFFAISIMTFSNNNTNPRAILGGAAIAATALCIAYKNHQYNKSIMEHEDKKYRERERIIQEYCNSKHKGVRRCSRPG